MPKIINRQLFLVLLVGAIVSCSNDQEYVTTESGFKYKYITRGDGAIPQNGQVLILNLAYQDDTGQEMYNTFSQGAPVPVLYQTENFSDNGSLEEGFKLLQKGDSMHFEILAEKVYEETFKIPLPDTVARGSYITFKVGVADIWSQEQVGQWQQEQNRKQQEASEVQRKNQLANDIAIIDDFLKGNNINAEKSETGLRYTILKDGKGDRAKSGETVKVDYIGKVLNGAYFDTSIESEAKKQNIYDRARTPYIPYQFVLGTGAVIKGWDEGIKLLNKGAKARLYIPSGMAYGPREVDKTIKSNSILVFDVELVDVVK